MNSYTSNQDNVQPSSAANGASNELSTQSPADTPSTTVTDDPNSNASHPYSTQSAANKASPKRTNAARTKALLTMFVCSGKEQVE